jgi:hypothetical protein
LKSKYQNAKTILDKMTNLSFNERPDCKEVLDCKDLWALSEEEAHFDEEFKNTIKSRASGKEITVYHLLKAMLKIED